MPYIKKQKDIIKQQRQTLLDKINVQQKDIMYKNPDSKSKAAYYGQTAWKKLRQRKLQDQPLCELCQRRGITRAASDCHHAIKFWDQFTPELKQQLLLDYDNLVSLCETCHQHVHKNPDLVWPEQKQYLYDKKMKVSAKYFDQGIMIRWTEDRHKNIPKTKYY